MNLGNTERPKPFPGQIMSPEGVIPHRTYGRFHGGKRLAVFVVANAPRLEMVGGHEQWRVDISVIDSVEPSIRPASLSDLGIVSYPGSGVWSNTYIAEFPPASKTS